MPAKNTFLTLQRYLRAKTLFEGGDADAEAAEPTEGAIAMGFGGAAGGGLPVVYLLGDFTESSSAFGRVLIGIKLRFDGGLYLADRPPAVFPPASV